LMQNDRDVSMQGHCVSGTIHLANQGFQKIRAGTHRSGRPVSHRMHGPEAITGSQTSRSFHHQNLWHKRLT